MLAPGTGEWTAAVAVLAAKRLNVATRGEQRDRWARSRTVTRLEPVRVLRAGAGDDDDPGGRRPAARRGLDHRRAALAPGWQVPASPEGPPGRALASTL